MPPDLAPKDPMILARGLGKTYRIHDSPGAQLADMLSLGRRRGRPYTALERVSFEVRRGESIGIIGRNGAGKSTLLQLICGLIEPSAGALTVRGRIAGLLELGAGFDPDFSGRENVLLAATILGLSEAEAKARFPAIEAFAGIGDFIDRPVREYSSGMYARLAFAVAIHVDADIMVIDEILSVGDAAFQRKCGHALQRFLEQGGTVLFVSHDEGAVLAHCERAIWLDRGVIREDGPSRAVCRLYAQSLHEADTDQALENPSARDACAGGVSENGGELLPAPPRLTDPRRAGANPIQVIEPPPGEALWHGESGARIERVAIHSPDGALLAHLQGGDEIELRITCRALRRMTRPIVGYILRNAAGENLAGDNTFLRYRDLDLTIEAGDVFSASFILQLPYLPAGDHWFAPSIVEGTQRSHIHVHWIENALCLRVERSPIHLGAIGLPAQSVTLEFA